MSDTRPNDAAAPASPFERLRQTFGVEPREVAAVAASFAYFFSVLCSYYIIRPLRDEMGVTVGRDGLERLFTIVFFVMLAAVPVFGWVVSNFSRRMVAPIVYAFFISNLILFWLLLSKGPPGTFLAASFFVWVSVFNLFVVSLFWIVMADVWTSSDAKRLYGLIAAGGSAGAFCGPLITQTFVHVVGVSNLLLISAVILSIALVLSHKLRELMGRSDQEQQRPAGQGLLDGAKRIWESPYLFQIALWVLVANLISTFFYFEQARIVGAAITNQPDRVQLFARMDLAVSALTIFGQIFLTANVIKRFGIGRSIAALPASAALGLLALFVAPVLWVIVAVIVIERAIGFAITNPAAKVLYTVTTPEDKYKAQNFNDTVVFRGGDAASGWIFNSVAKGLGISTPAVAMLTVPFALYWVWLSLKLGREQEQMAESQQKSATA